MGGVDKVGGDVVFVDMEMGGMSGVEMVGMVEGEDGGYIVFVRGFEE